MKLVAVIRSTDTKEIVVEAASYAEAKAQIKGQVDEWWQLQSIREAE